MEATSPTAPHTLLGLGLSKVGGGFGPRNYGGRVIDVTFYIAAKGILTRQEGVGVY